MKILVIGGSKGIGKACTELLLEEGHEVIVAARSNDEISHLPIEFLDLDVTKDVSVLEDLDALNGLIYCPGSINLKPFHRLDANDFQNDLEINLFGAIKSIQTCLPALKTGNGSIVLFSTVAVTQGMPFHSSVSVSKGAIEGLMRSLAAEYAPAIRVNAIAPSLTETPLASALISNEKKKEASEARHPLKRIGKAEDIASLAVHLVSKNGSWISGQVIGVDGGMSRLR
ncbi:SDR family oxidoreductase [Salibacteraceae bacterium]|nr:SDR family oxidoreductase [Salibacteraceae bacterium]